MWIDKYPSLELGPIWITAYLQPIRQVLIMILCANV